MSHEGCTNNTRSDGLWDDEDEWGYVRTVVKKLWPGEEIRMPSGVRKADDDDEESDEFGSIDLEDTEDENSEDEVVALLVEATKTVNI
ncbi:hypothetical protein HII31_05455 [Pseudocercospora fuligena]|uniref:Uncharacterized protein n=1 Tax=Pseudocercospora fuligena TaxID=685502 RepID=A0A8H6VM67_9PEZI|nr:hypothetical protein HII31_05455 [Pseudocercospora fuligena]